MITEYQTTLFHKPDNHDKQSQVDELFDLACKDIRYARNKLYKVQDKILSLSRNSIKENTTEETDTVELLSTMYQASILSQLHEVADRATDMIKEFQNHQKNRLAKVDDIVDTIASQIDQKRQEREGSDDWYCNFIAQSSYDDEMAKLNVIKRELISLKEKAANDRREDAP